MGSYFWVPRLLFVGDSGHLAEHGKASRMAVGGGHDKVRTERGS